MSAQFLIELKGLRFFAEHGMYQEEVLVGNEFEVSVSLACKAPKKEINSINQTINYVEVFRIVQQVFNTRTQLLEKCAMQISEELYKQFPEILKTVISIYKLHPPITNFSGSVGVVYSKEFK